MIFEAWEFRRRLKYLDEWKEVLIEKDDDRLKQILQEILDKGVSDNEPAYTETAGALLNHFDLIAPVRQNLQKGSDLSEITFLWILRGGKNDRS